jgi:dTDP-4-dehydrorhamnose reductase
MMVITGGSGRLGTALQTQFQAAVYPGRAELDVCNSRSVDLYVKHHKPNMLIHAAAMTDVRAAETDRKACWETNVSGTERLVDVLGKFAPECYFVYVSTACVFQGDRGNYSEEDLPNPKNCYGQTKLIAEYISRRMKNHLIIRTNFVACEPWPYPRAFVDRFGTYLYADDVALALRRLVEQQGKGLVHIAGDKRMSMFELAKLTSPAVLPLTMDEVQLPLTIDMTLRSMRMEPLKIGSARALAVP